MTLFDVISTNESRQSEGKSTRCRLVVEKSHYVPCPSTKRILNLKNAYFMSLSNLLFINIFMKNLMSMGIGKGQ